MRGDREKEKETYTEKEREGAEISEFVIKRHIMYLVIGS